MTRPSVARALQLVADARDDQLTALVRARRPGIKHWWGRRGWTKREVNVYDFGRAGEYEGFPQYEHQTGAWCYLCDTPIATWSSRWPMTEAARAAVSVHRDLEIRRHLDVPAPATVEERP